MYPGKALGSYGERPHVFEKLSLEDPAMSIAKPLVGILVRVGISIGTSMSAPLPIWTWMACGSSIRTSP